MGLKDIKKEEIIQRIKNKAPTCPVCATKMRPVNYCGYYDSHSCWACNCSEFPKEIAEEWFGAYA